MHCIQPPFLQHTFDSINHFHVHMYISRWGPEEQFPQSRNKLQLNQSHVPVSCPFGQRRRPLNEGGGNWSANAVIELAPFSPSWRSSLLLTRLVPKAASFVSRHAMR